MTALRDFNRDYHTNNLRHIAMAHIIELTQKSSGNYGALAHCIDTILNDDSRRFVLVVTNTTTLIEAYQTFGVEVHGCFSYCYNAAINGNCDIYLISLDSEDVIYKIDSIDEL